MSSRAIGGRCAPVSLAIAPASRAVRPVTAGTYVSPARVPRDHTAREARRVIAKHDARAARLRRGNRPVLLALRGVGKARATPTRAEARLARSGGGWWH